MVVIRDPKVFYFDFYFPKDDDKNLKHEIEFIIKSNESSAENKIKNEIDQILSKYKHGNNIYGHGKRFPNEPYKFNLNLSQRLDLRSLNKHVALQKLSIYYNTWKNIIKLYKNNKLKIIAPMWNDEFELPDGSCSVSDIQDYVEYIIKKHKTLTTIPLIHV